MSVNGIRMAMPKRSNNRPKTSEPVPLTAMATAYAIGTQFCGTDDAFAK